MKTTLIILAIMALVGGVLYAKGKVVKTDNGFSVTKPVEPKTYFESKISWGDGYTDHTASTPITGIAVLATGNGWTYSAMTDENGVFKIEVEAGKPFNLKISDGNTWIDYDIEIAGIAEGTTFSELK